MLYLGKYGDLNDTSKPGGTYHCSLKGKSKLTSRISKLREIDKGKTAKEQSHRMWIEMEAK
jgi:hypothetical protein